MRYFKFGDVPSAEYTTAHSVTDADGKSVITGDRLVAENCETMFAELRNDKEIPDRLFSIGGDLILSERGSKVVCGLQLGPTIKLFPVTLHRKRQVIREDYNLFYSTVRHDVLHRQKADIRFVKGHVYDVKRWVLDKGLLPPLDLFYALPLTWIASENMVKMFASANLRGCSFLEVETV